jgi:hypothetical protein
MRDGLYAVGARSSDVVIQRADPGYAQHLGTSRNRNQCQRQSSGRATKGNLLLSLRYRPNQDDRNPALLDRDER